jgi:cellulose synthase/poly-beta-1,6-N-acetylglucosamine synthase-like glycosyltransferase
MWFLDYAFEIIDGIVACFTANLTWQAAVSTYWFLFAVEFPRYYLLDLTVALRFVTTFNKRRARQALARRRLFVEKPLITILAPGKNEGARIYNLVKSLREQTYQNYEILIIDDGSNDATPFICRDLESSGYITHYYRMRDRGGKASAANYGAFHAHGKYIVHLDADSSLDRDAIETILLPFYYDPAIKGVGGCVKVRNANESVCSSLQALEYLKTIQIGRMVTNMLGLYHIISGAFGAFETEAIRQVGCWDIGPGLDGDITQKLRKAGYRVWFAEDAICMTDVPTSWFALFRQRIRWCRSLIRFRVRKHSDVFKADKNFSFSNAISNLDNIVFDCVFNYVWFFYMIQLIFMNTDRLLEIIIVGWLIRVAFSTVAFGVIMVVSERRSEEWWLLPYLLVSTFYTGYFLRIARLIAHTAELFFFQSYKDPWNPEKTSIYARLEGM